MPIEYTPKPKELKGLDFVVCHRVKDLPIPKKPAKITHCSKCGERIWLGHASPQTTPVICVQCCLADAQADDDVKLFVGDSVARSLADGITHPDTMKLIELAIKPGKKP